MPIHDWTRPTPGVFHHFHQMWTAELCNALNGGVLPDGYMAVIDQRALGYVPDVLTMMSPKPAEPGGGVAVARPLPQTRFVSHRPDSEVYAARANRIAVRTDLGKLVAIVEIVSPGNKESRNAIRSFRQKVVEFLKNGVHVSLIDLFPPTRRDPQGLHKVIWDDIREEVFELPADKPLTLAAYVAAPVFTAFVEPVAVGDALPALPVFLYEDMHVPAPLEESYARTWEKCPAGMKAIVTHPPA